MTVVRYRRHRFAGGQMAFRFPTTPLLRSSIEYGWSWIMEYIYCERVGGLGEVSDVRADFHN
jgi:hypothetical protein